MMIVWQFISWYLVISLTGWLVFPLVYRLLPFLPERGLAFSRPFGLILCGYLYWLLVSLHILQNDLGGVVFALLAAAGLSLWSLRQGGWSQLVKWLKSHRAEVLAVEALFLAAFGAWTVVRAAIPDASGTEKPMELAFINAILRSPSFPPADPWLSGYAISYYYFGYVITAMLARLAFVPGAVAFNLAAASWFGLAALAAYGLLFNLLALRRKADRKTARSLALLAPLFLLVVSNMGGFLEVLHSAGVFWRQTDAGAWQSDFWTWLDIQELNQPPAPPFTGVPERPAGIWWWRSSRVLQDYTLDGQPREVIDEFPMFSFLLGDLHPHVLAMPFALLSAALALNICLKRGRYPNDPPGLLRWLRQAEFWAAALVLGGLAFLNTWDFPIYLVLFGSASLLPALLYRGWRWPLLLDFLSCVTALGAAGGILYLPFYLTFASQAGGILPSLAFFTRGIHFWVMFASLLIPSAAWLIMIWLRGGQPEKIWPGLFLAACAAGGLWLLSCFMGLFRLSSDPPLAAIWGAASPADLILISTGKRISSPGTWLTLLVLLALVWSLFQRFIQPADLPPDVQNDAPVRDACNAERPVPFVLLLFLAGAGLALFPEFFYLRDLFGVRMNTIFKFYFQTWILWSMAAAYGSAAMLLELRGGWRTAFKLGWLALVVLALPYPVFGVLSRTNNFHPVQWSLDGSAYLERYSPDEMAAIAWLQQAPYGVVAEAVGGSYTGYARVSTHSGLPSVLGWPGHESQWRGGMQEIGSREPDIETLFRAKQWSQASQVIEKYNIRYIYLGPLERSTYRPDEALFQRNLPVVFKSSGVTIYEVPRYNFVQGQITKP